MRRSLLHSLFFGVAGLCTAQSASIMPDGAFGDWTPGLSAFTDDNAPASGIDLLAMRATNDASYLYLLLVVGTELDLQDDLVPQTIRLYIDGDNNAASGTNADIHSIFFLNDTLGFTGGGGGLRTTDGGDTWTYLGGLPQYTKSIFFTHPDTGYAVSVSGQVVRTTDGGNAWVNIVPAPFDAIIGDATLAEGALIAVGRYGDVYRAPLACPAVPAVPTVLQSGQTLCTAWRPQLQWYLDGLPLPNATWPCITAPTSGSYTVVYTDALGCTSAPSVPVQIINTAAPAPIATAFTAFPNPTTGSVTLSFADAAPRTVLLCDARGRVLHTQRTNGSTATVHLHHLPAGLYILREAGGGNAVRVVRE